MAKATMTAWVSSAKVPTRIILLLIIFCVTFIFAPSFSNFFAGDDFYNIRLSQMHNIIADFNLFSSGPLDFLVYRPLTVQLYWWLGQKIFGLEVVGYHIINYLFFAVNIVLTYVLGRQLSLKKGTALLAAGLMAISTTHFYRLYFLTQIQELALTIFVLASCCCYLGNKKVWAIIFFIIALCSKETAFMLPVFLAVIDFIRLKKVSMLLIGFFLVALIYFVAHKFIYGLYSSGPYQYIFSVKPTVNNIMWYLLWTIGLPEAYVNSRLFSGSTLLNPQIFSNYGPLAKWIIGTAVVFIATLGISFATTIKRFSFKNLKQILVALCLYILFLLPVAFFPFHKFGYSLTLPVIGFSLCLSIVIRRQKKSFQAIILGSFVLLALLTNYYNYTTHWSRLRSLSVAAIFYDQSLQQRLYRYSGPIYIRNSLEPVCYAAQAGGNASGQLGLSFFDHIGWSILFPYSSQSVYFEDYDQLHTFSDQYLLIDASKYQQLPI